MPCSGENTTVPRARTLDCPDLFLLDWVPGDEFPFDRVENGFLDLGILRHPSGDDVETIVGRESLSLKSRFGLVREPRFIYGDICQSSQRTKRHGLPAMGSEWAGDNQLRRGARVSRSCRLDWPPGFHVDSSCPIHVSERLRGDQLTVRAIEHVEEAVLRSLHENLACFAADIQVGQDHVFIGVEVPLITRILLVVPDVLTGGESQG